MNVRDRMTRDRRCWALPHYGLLNKVSARQIRAEISEVRQ
jgi:hypothetical protein